jgi:hypothetical protein
MSVKVSDKWVTVELSGDLIDNLDQIATDAERRIIRSMHDTVTKVMAEAREFWPKRTGRTERSWRTVVRLIDGGSKVQAYITNDATNPKDGFRYPFAVLTPAEEGYERRWVREVNQPLKDEAKNLVKLLEADLVAAAGD